MSALSFFTFFLKKYYRIMEKNMKKGSSVLDRGIIFFSIPISLPIFDKVYDLIFNLVKGSCLGSWISWWKHVDIVFNIHTVPLGS